MEQDISKQLAELNKVFPQRKQIKNIRDSVDLEVAQDGDKEVVIAIYYQFNPNDVVEILRALADYAAKATTPPEFISILMVSAMHVPKNAEISRMGEAFNIINTLLKLNKIENVLTVYNISGLQRLAASMVGQFMLGEAKVKFEETVLKRLEKEEEAEK